MIKVINIIVSAKIAKKIISDIQKGQKDLKVAVVYPIQTLTLKSLTRIQNIFSSEIHF